jgi:hypothetical protein
MQKGCKMYERRMQKGNAHQMERIDQTKKGQLADKKRRLETRGFRATFLLLTTPYVMFE